MKLFRYGLVCLICGLVILSTGCQKGHDSVVNTRSGVVIHSSDFTVGVKQKVSDFSSKRKSDEDRQEPRVSGNVIHLGDGYEKIDLGPLFRD
ncbi:MAG: hypothetical protein KHX03_05690 [Clostridium sp.]|nr:hypothetical protein [Clostridium sp.]